MSSADHPQLPRRPPASRGPPVQLPLLAAAASAAVHPAAAAPVVAPAPVVSSAVPRATAQGLPPQLKGSTALNLVDTIAVAAAAAGQHHQLHPAHQQQQQMDLGGDSDNDEDDDDDEDGPASSAKNGKRKGAARAGGRKRKTPDPDEDEDDEIEEPDEDLSHLSPKDRRIHELKHSMKAEYDRCALARKKTEVAHWFIQKKASDPNITYADALRAVWPEKLEECQKDWNTKERIRRSVRNWVHCCRPKENGGPLQKVLPVGSRPKIRSERLQQLMEQGTLAGHSDDVMKILEEEARAQAEKDGLDPKSNAGSVKKATLKRVMKRAGALNPEQPETPAAPKAGGPFGMRLPPGRSRLGVNRKAHPLPQRRRWPPTPGGCLKCGVSREECKTPGAWEECPHKCDDYDGCLLNFCPDCKAKPLAQIDHSCDKVPAPPPPKPRIQSRRKTSSGPSEGSGAEGASAAPTSASAAPSSAPAAAASSSSPSPAVVASSSSTSLPTDLASAQQASNPAAHGLLSTAAGRRRGVTSAQQQDEEDVGNAQVMAVQVLAAAANMAERSTAAAAAVAEPAQKRARTGAKDAVVPVLAPPRRPRGPTPAPAAAKDGSAATMVDDPQGDAASEAAGAAVDAQKMATRKR